MFKFIYKDEIDSTSNLARRLAEEGAGEGLVVVAEKQSAGRGRRGKSFLSPDAQVEFENLMTSLVEEYGVGNQEVKSAYLNFVSQFFKHTLSLELKIKNAIDYQTFAKYTRAEAKAKVGKVIETSEDYIVLLGLDTNLRKECFNVAKKVGQAVLDNFMSDEDKNILRESADLLNQNGLGLFIKNYVDLYRYGVNFIGHALTNVTETDFLQIRETIIGKVGNGEKATALSNKFYADILLRVYNNYGAKDKLKKSFNLFVFPINVHNPSTVNY